MLTVCKSALHFKGKREGLYKFRSRPKKKSRFWQHAASLLAILGTIIFWSSRNPPPSSARIFSDGIKIQITRASPPFAALEDSLNDFEDESAVSPFAPVTLLGAEATERFTNLANAILSSNAQIVAQRAREQQTIQKLAQAKARTEALEKAKEAERRLAEAKRTQDDMEVGTRVNGPQPGQNRVVTGVVIKTSPNPGVSTQALGSGRGQDVLVADPNVMLITGGKLILLTEEGMKMAQAELARTPQDADQMNIAGDSLPREVAANHQEPHESSRTIHLDDLKINRAELVKSLFFPLIAAATQAEQKKAGNAHQIATAGARGGAVTASRGARTRPVASESGFVSPDSAVVGQHLRDAMSEALASRPSKKGEGRERNSGKDELSELGQIDDVAASFAPSNDKERQLVISGPLELTGGLAFTSQQDQIRVFRQIDDQKLESGNVRLREGRYEIFVDNLGGILVAELLTSRGVVIGRGVFDLYDMPPLQHNQTKSSAIALKLQPVTDSFRGLVQSADSYKEKTPTVGGASLRIDEIDADIKAGSDGRFVDRQIATGSTVILEAHKDGYWRSLGFATAGYDNGVTLYSDKMMKAFVELVIGQSHADPKQQAIVWGKVTKEGRAVAGAKVEMLTGTTEVKPIYFNSLMIPDPTLETTTANGMYAFFPIEAGVHAVQASINDVATDPILFPAEPGYISPMDLETARLRRADLKVFDAFNPQDPLSAQIAAVGAERGFEINGTGHLVYRYSAGSALILLEADAGRDYAVTRYSFPRDRRFLFMPMIKQSWLDQIGGRKRVNREPGAGVILGFIQSSEPYQVYPQANAISPSTRVVYFDARGKALSSDYGIPGGGYLIFNVAEGFHTVSVVTSKGGPAQSQTTLVDKDVLNVTNHFLSTR